jgi:hypothetical protein
LVHRLAPKAAKFTNPFYIIISFTKTHEFTNKMNKCIRIYNIIFATRAGKTSDEDEDEENEEDDDEEED